MKNQDKPILYWILGIVILLGVILYSTGTLKEWGLYSMTCTSNEPSTLEENKLILESSNNFGSCKIEQEPFGNGIACGINTDLYIAIYEIYNKSCVDFLASTYDNDTFTHPNLQFYKSNQIGNEYIDLDFGLIYVCNNKNKLLMFTNETFENNYINTFFTCVDEPDNKTNCWNRQLASGPCVQGICYPISTEGYKVSFNTKEECIKETIINRGGTTCNVDSDCSLTQEETWLVAECQNFQCVDAFKRCSSDSDCRWIDEKCTNYAYPIDNISRCTASGRFNDCSPAGCNYAHFSFGLLANPFNWFNPFIFVPALLIIVGIGYLIYKSKK